MVGGLLFYWIGAPAPFMLGSLLICWVTAALIKPLRHRMDTPQSVRRVFLTAVALILGSYATPQILASAASWWPSLLGLAVSSTVMMTVSYWYFARFRGYEPAVAWFSAQPAGLTEMIIMSREHTDKDYLVALFHLVRVSTIFLLTPLIIWVGAPELNPQAVPAGQVHIWQVPLLDWPWWLGLGMAGVILGKLLRLPMPFLLGLMVLSAVVSGSGLVALDRPFEVVCLTQVALGGGIGVRMGQVDFRALSRAVPDAYVNASIVIGVALMATGGLSLWTGEPMLKLFLAISPGGVSELSLLAVALGYEVAFVTLHHLWRMAYVLGTMPLWRKVLWRTG